MIQEIYDRYHKELAAKERKLELSISSGKCDSYEAYKHLSGKLQGIKEARDIFDHVCKNYAEVVDE